MVKTVVYDGLTLQNPSPPKDFDLGIKSNERRMVSGATSVNVSKKLRLKTSFRCKTTSQGDVEAIINKVTDGKKASLFIDGVEWPGCKITNLRYGWINPSGSDIWYEVEFTQETRNG